MSAPFLKTTDLKLIKAGAPFTWGNILKIHEIWRYTIIEAAGRDNGGPLFHCYVDDKYIHHASKTMEGALILCFAAQYTQNPNDAGHNARCAGKVLGIPTDY